MSGGLISTDGNGHLARVLSLAGAQSVVAVVDTGYISGWPAWLETLEPMWTLGETWRISQLPLDFLMLTPYKIRRIR